MQGARVPSAGLQGRKGRTRGSPKSLIFLLGVKHPATAPVPDMQRAGMMRIPIHTAVTSLPFKEIKTKLSSFRHLLQVFPREKALGIRNDSAVMRNSHWMNTYSTAAMHKSCGSQRRAMALIFRKGEERFTPANPQLSAIKNKS